MKKIILVGLSLLALSCRTTQKVAQSSSYEEEMLKNITHNLIISYQNQKTLAHLKKEVQKYGAEMLYEYKIIKGIAIKVPQDKDIRQAKAYFSNLKGVTNVEYDQINHIDH